MTMQLKWDLPFFARYGEALQRSSIIQGILLMAINNNMRAFDKDPHRFVMLGCIAYWLTVLFMMLRRENRLTRTDSAVLNWGLIPMIVGVWILASVMMRFKP